MLPMCTSCDPCTRLRLVAMQRFAKPSVPLGQTSMPRWRYAPPAMLHQMHCKRSYVFHFSLLKLHCMPS